MQDRIVTLIGGTGFLGRYAVRSLAKAGYRLRVVSRRPEAALELKTAGELGQVALLKGDLSRPETLIPYLQGSDAVIDLVGILFESRRRRFSSLHAQGPEKLAQAAYAAGVSTFIYVSALNVDQATDSAYARSKALGEKAVIGAFPNAVILRPSIIFGPEDQFFNRFARMAMLSPVVPLIGADTRFQPVYVGDVAEAIRVCVETPAAAGALFELGGPEIYTFRQLMEYMLHVIGRKRVLLPIPFPLAGMLAFFAEFNRWNPPLTRDQVRLLRHDNMVNPEAAGLPALGITPTALEMVVEDYLACYRKGNRAAVGEML